MSEFLSLADVKVELKTVRLTETLAVCRIASDDKFEAGKHGLQMHYCGRYILFSRPGELPEAIGLAVVKQMVSMADYQKHEAEKEAVQSALAAAQQKTAEQQAAEFRAAKEAAARPAPAPAPVSESSMMKDLKADKDVSEEEERSMKAAIARATAKSKRRK